MQAHMLQCFEASVSVLTPLVAAATCSTGARRTRPAVFRTQARLRPCSSNNVRGRIMRWCLRAQLSACRTALLPASLPTQHLPACLHACPAAATTCSVIKLPPFHWLPPCHAGELRYQELVDPKNGIPPYLLVKGTAAGSFRAGAPVSAWGPPLPGYDRKTAGGLYGQPGTPCADRFK